LFEHPSATSLFHVCKEKIDLKICWKHSTSRARSADDEQRRAVQINDTTLLLLRQPALHSARGLQLLRWRGLMSEAWVQITRRKPGGKSKRRFAFRPIDQWLQCPAPAPLAAENLAGAA